MWSKLHIREGDVSLNFTNTKRQLGGKISRVQDFNVRRELHPGIGRASVQLDREFLSTQCNVRRVLV